MIVIFFDCFNNILHNKKNQKTKNQTKPKKKKTRHQEWSFFKQFQGDTSGQLIKI